MNPPAGGYADLTREELAAIVPELPAVRRDAPPLEAQEVTVAEFSTTHASRTS